MRRLKEAVDHPALPIFQQVAGGLPGEGATTSNVQWILLIARKYQLSPDQLANLPGALLTTGRRGLGRTGKPGAERQLAVRVGNWSCTACMADMLVRQPGKREQVH